MIKGSGFRVVSLLSLTECYQLGNDGIISRYGLIINSYHDDKLNFVYLMVYLMSPSAYDRTQKADRLV